MITKSDESKIIIGQDLLQKNKEALETAFIKLESVLRYNLETFTNPQLTDHIIKERLSTIFSLLGEQIQSLPELTANNINEYVKRLSTLEELHDSLQPSLISKINRTGAREKIKMLLNIQDINFRETIDPYINRYLAAQRDVLAYFIAIYNAHQQAQRIIAMKKLYPEAQIEIINLKRHEVCSDVHKVFGFNPDTGLDALHFVGQQSMFALTTAKSVHQQQIQLMKTAGYIHKVDLTVSPVTRAYETAIHATFSPTTVDTVTVDNHFAEEQMNTTLIASGRAYRFAREVVNEFLMHGYKNVLATEDFLIHGENKILFLKRRNEACRRMLSSLAVIPGQVIMKVIVGHGAMNNSLIAFLKHHIKYNNIPHARRRLDFGEQYNVIIAKDELHNIIALVDGGKVSRYGVVEQAFVEQVPVLSIDDYIVKLKMAIQEEESSETKAILLFSLCMIEQSNLSEIINTQENLNLMLDNLPLFECNNFEEIDRIETVLQSLIEAQYFSLENRIAMEKTSSNYWFFSNISNYASGKFPADQMLILNKLLDVKNYGPTAALEQLEKIVKESEILCKEGKVTNLCRAKLKAAQYRFDYGPLMALHCNNGL